jgi:hypothetical protein
MRLIVSFRRLNPDFDQKYAQEYNLGKEGEGNWKIAWEETFELNNPVDVITLIESDEMIVSGVLSNGNELTTTLSNMTYIKCVSDDCITAEIGMSNALVESTSKYYNKKQDKLNFYFYFNDRTDFERIGSRIFMVRENIPNEFIKKVPDKG